MNIYLDSSPINIAPDGANLRYEPRGEVARRYDQALMSSVTVSRGYVRVWELTTAEELAADIDALEALLATPGALSFSGDLLTSGSVEVYAGGIQRRVGRNNQYAVLFFELREGAVIGADRKELVRVWVADSGDTLQDLSEWFMGATVTADVEQFAKAAQVSFWRESATESKAPLMSSPPPIMPGRRIEIETAVIGIEETVTENDWHPIFVGRIDDTAWGGDASRITVPCRDGAGGLHDAWIKTPTTYGSNVSPVRLDLVMQQILSDHISASPPVPFLVPAPPDSYFVEEELGRQSVAEALIYCRDLIGWDLRYLWNASDSEYQLTFYEPDRSKTVPDHVFTTDDYFEVSGVELSALGVRNYVEVDWSETLGAVVVQDETSQAEYANDVSDGIYYLYLDETRNSQINTFAAAFALAEAVLAETAFPSLSHQARNVLTPEIEIGDLCRYPANGIHYNSSQDVAVVGYTHELRPEGNETLIQARGAPSGSVTRWHRKGKKAVQQQFVEEAIEDLPALVERVRWYYTTATGPGYSTEGTAETSLGGYVSKTEVALGLHGLFRQVTEEEAAAGITLYRSVAVANTDVGDTARDWECVIGFLTPDTGISGDYVWSIAVDSYGVVETLSADQQSAISPYEEAPPDDSPALGWISPLEDESPVLDVGTLAPGYARIVHIRLEVLPGATGQYTNEAMVLVDQVPS